MKKSFAIFFLILFVAQIYGAVLFFPQRVNAQPVPIGVMTDIPRKLQEATDKIAKKLQEAAKKLMESAIPDAFYRVVMNFTQRLSSSIGKTLAEGGKGGGSFFDGRAFGDAVKEAGEAAVGDAIDAIGQGIGVNLCLPPEIRLGLSFGLAKALEPTKPKCTFQDFKDKWQKFGESFSDEEIFSQHFSAALNPAQSEVGLAGFTLLQTDALHTKAEREAELKRLADKGYEGRKELISGQTTTPPDILAEQGKQNFVIQLPASKEPKLTGNLWPDVKTVAVYNFFATFTETAMKRIFEGIFSPKPPKPSRRAGGALGSLGSGSTSSGGGAKALDVQGVSFSSTGSEFDLMSEFTTCPEQGQSIYNCVLDQNFAQAIRDGMTIREAIKNNFNNRLDGATLNVTLPFGYGGTTGQEQLRYDSGYAYHNLKKLRRARIIPVGWELAAEIIKARRQFATLGDVLKGFDDPTSDFYRLVDPDWLLKAPLYYCKATAPGQLVTPGSEDRLEYCVDLQDCVAPTEDGNGCQSWGYCTRERNTWRFDAKQCDAQFNTCLSYKQEDSGQTIAYNKNTTQSCNANEVGCRWFSLKERGLNDKGEMTWDANPRRYFNRTVSECNAQANGCTEFARLTDTTTGKPLTVAQYIAAKDAAATASKNYEDYSTLGVEATPSVTAFATKRQTIKYIGGALNDCRGPQGNETANVGCDRFTPTSGVDAPVPAVMQSNDECPTSCVGYDAYEEVSSVFSRGNFPEYFIPSSARTCSADVVGCEEFTNLDVVGKQGEAREYFTALRQCQKPATDSRTYYTWVGTEKTGYQLETHSLKASNLDGGKAPCTTRDLQNGNICNEAVQGGTDTRALCAKADLLTNPDCREFYDEKGNISYRLYSKTIISSDACIRYRMTNSEGADNCRNTGGEWSGTSCIYLVLPQESRSCSAEAVGCREYKGNTANDIRVVRQQDFEKEYKDAAGNRIPPPDWVIGKISSASLAQNGHSLETDGGRVAVALTKYVKDLNGVITTVADVSENRTYLLSFWAKSLGGNIDVDPVLTNGGGKETRFAWNMPNARLPLTTDWQKYNIGPVFVTWAPDAAVRLEINGTSFVIDNFILQEVRDDFYLIKNSWTTPRECLYKQDASGDYTVLRAGDDRVIGCRAYTDRAKNPYAVKAFHQLCQEEFVGCEALVNTHNTTKPEGKDFGNGVTVPQDDIAYVVNDPKNYCASSEKGCSAMSAPQAVNLGGVFAASTVYKLNDPEKYTPDQQGKGSILCTAQNLACEAYTKSAGGEDYFIDPYAKVTSNTGKPTTCEWKQYSKSGMSQKFGWFNKGSSAAEAGLDPDCTSGFVKECPAEADRCSQFVDTQDLSRSVARSILNESFEATTFPFGWKEVSSVPTTLTVESGGIIEQRALHAVGQNGGRPYVSFTLGTQQRPGPIHKGGAYRLSFWVKGDGGTIVTWFGGAPAGGYFQEAGGISRIPITSNWTYHRLTRVAEEGESGADKNLRFEGGGNLTSLYLDGVQLEGITDVNDTGRPFYVIDDETLTKKRDRTLCSVVDQKAGCVLFQSANKGASQWDSTLSYQAGTPVTCNPGETVCVGASNENNGKVYGRGTDAAACTGAGGKGIACIGPDTNDLLKVKRDRVCGEWLSCVSGTQVLDKQTQKLKNTCYAVGSCTEPSQYNAASCGRMKDVDRDPQLLNIDLYKARDLTWKGKEYVGYSVPYQYPVTNFVQLPHAADPSTKVPAGYRLHSLALDYDAQGKPRTCTKNNEDIGNGGCGKGSGKACIFRGQGIGDIEQGFCYVDVGSGQTFVLSGQGAKIDEIQKSCRAYPAADAPFPESVVSIWHDELKISNGQTVCESSGGSWSSTTNECTYDTKLLFPELAKPKVKDGAFKAANISQKTSPRYSYGPAECSYRRVRYKDGETRFWGITGDFPDANIDVLQNEYGWQGYCLETDSSNSTPIKNGAGDAHACLTWFPVDLVQGEVDLNADAPEAGYIPSRRSYCVETRMEEQLPAASSTTKDMGYGNRGCINDPVQCRTGYTRGVTNDDCTDTSSKFDNVQGCSALPGVAESWVPYDGKTIYGDPGLSYAENYRIVCSKVALVENGGASLPWTDRFLGQHASNFTVPTVGYNITTPPVPYGAVSAFSLGQRSAIVINENNITKDGKAYARPFTTTDTNSETWEKYADGMSRLRGIFARIFGLWEQKTAAEPFVQIVPDVVDDAAATEGTGPIVRAAEYNVTKQSYSEGASGITVETQSSGRVEFNGTAQAVSVKFYAYNANGQQMPLRRVIVDWGDQTDLSVTKGSLKNRKNQCNRTCSVTTNADSITKKHCSKKEDCGGGVTDICAVANWGDDVNACVEDTIGGSTGYFTYTHIYRCEGPVSAAWQDDTNPGVAGNQSGCVFVPKAQVMDNWDWCNGTCSAKGCYNDPNPTGTKQCDASSEAWTRFGSGTDAIILSP